VVLLLLPIYLVIGVFWAIVSLFRMLAYAALVLTRRRPARSPVVASAGSRTNPKGRGRRGCPVSDCPKRHPSLGAHLAALHDEPLPPGIETSSVTHQERPHTGLPENYTERPWR
jgi:hypothetical protein